jgi:hypothetical protein
MALSFIVVVTLAVAFVAPAVAYPEYVAELPTHPRNARGVGHVSPGGGGLRNKFGEVSAFCPRETDSSRSVSSLLTAKTAMELESSKKVY